MKEINPEEWERQVLGEFPGPQPEEVLSDADIILLRDTYRLLKSEGRIQVARIQRVLKYGYGQSIGYTKAAWILAQFRKRGIISSTADLACSTHAVLIDLSAHEAKALFPFPESKP